MGSRVPFIPTLLGPCILILKSCSLLNDSVLLFVLFCFAFYESKTQ